MNRDEIARIAFGPEPGQSLGGLGSVRFMVKCSGNAEQILENSRQVMDTVLRQNVPLLSLEQWRTTLPKWFVQRCAPEKTKDEADKRLQLPIEERALLEKTEGWSLSGWIYWFQPENRNWYWWDARIENPDTIQIAVEVNEWPFPWGALKWLFIASGATDVEAEE